ncbi:MAG: NAD-dependent epimerase/dehydratase family protein [Pseudomonadota bacterium]|uniref:NAD-dependent epimerase/dehydratase family protein n=1 Tax=Roseovarius TaxID=74030 RepID=UPI0022A79754|nr:NAD(P)-dependent oxidoreductase [Roseovarius sp. EGI FJ00037]MCZ0811359.1 NAD(P)-dependent oxidoreductase [Roseovarius sp. EGI FJ00037]
MTETDREPVLLVTGASGFIGSRFVIAARDHGWRVCRLVRSPGQAGADDSLLFDGSISTLAAGLDRITCDVIVHCAASYSPSDDPAETEALLAANLVAPLKYLQAARLSGTRGIVNLGSLWEHDVNGARAPVNLYAQLKLAFQDSLDYFARAHGLRALSLKLADTYGEDDPRPKLLNLLRDCARTGVRLGLTAGDQIVNPVHVSDVTRAMLMACDRVLAQPAPVHEAHVVDGDEPLDIRQLVARAEMIWGRQLNVEWGAVPVAGRKPARIWTDGPRLPSWHPQLSLDAGLARLRPT